MWKSSIFLLLAFPLAQPQALSKLSREENQELSETCGIGSKCLVPKVYGGQLACAGQFPWAVAIRMRMNFSAAFPKEILDILNTSQPENEADTFELASTMCTGTLISKRHVLSAAHCIYMCPEVMSNLKTDSEINVLNMSKMPDMSKLYKKEFLIGAVDVTTPEKKYVFEGKVIKMNKIWKEKKCQDGGDLSLIELDRDVPSEIATPICLPSSRDMRFDGPITGAGFGFVPRAKEQGKANKELRYVDLELFDDFVLRNDSSDHNRPFGTLVTVETADKNVCKGDSGGPLMMYELKTQRTTLAGVTSFGEYCENQYENKKNNISKEYSGGVFSDTRHFVKWICDNTNVGNCEQKSEQDQDFDETKENKETKRKYKAQRILRDLKMLYNKHRRND